MQIKHLTDVKQLPPENQVKLKKSKFAQEKLEKLLEGEKQFNEAFDRILNFQIEISDEIRPALDWLMNEALEKVPINLQMAQIVARLGDPAEWKHVGFERLTLVNHLIQHLLVTGREQAEKFAKAYVAFSPAFKLLTDLENERTIFAKQITTLESDFQRELQVTNLTKADKEEVKKLTAEALEHNDKVIKDIADSRAAEDAAGGPKPEAVAAQA